MTKSNRQPANGGRIGEPWPFDDEPLGSVLMETSLSEQCGPSHTHQGPTETATNGRLHCSIKQIALG